MTGPLKRLGDLARVQGGRTPKSLDRYLAERPHQGRDIPFYKVGDLQAAAKLRVARTQLSKADIAKLGLEVVPAGSVVFPKAGGAIATNKKRTVEVPGPVDLNCMAVTPGPQLVPEYLRLWFESFNLSSIADGSVLPQISKKKVTELYLPQYSLGEQRIIVDLLEGHFSRLDAAASGLIGGEQRLRALEQSALNAHFGGELGVRLGELVTEISAGRSFGSTNMPAAYDEWGIIKVSAMTWGAFDPTANKAVPASNVDPRFEIREGDLLLSRANTAEYVGASVLVPSVRPKLLLSDKSLRISPQDGVRREWLWRALQAPSARRQISELATGTKDSMRNISQVSLRQVMLPLASVDDQDQALAAFDVVRTASSRLRSEIAAQRTRLGGLRRSLFSAAFSGRLTTPGFDPHR